MENIKKFEIELEGLCPLLMDRFDTEPSNLKTQEDYIKSAEKKVYVDKDGLIIPGVAIKATIREASSELGMKREGKKNRQMIRAGVFIEDLKLGKKTHDGIVSHVVTRGKGDKVTRVMSYRPIIKEWKAKGKMSLIGVPSDFVKQALELAGVKYGLMSYRPEFGRFVLKSFKEVKQ
jgi:hypothetical protein